METKLDFLVKEAQKGREELVELLQKLADSSEELKGLKVEIDIWMHNAPVEEMPQGSVLENYPGGARGLVAPCEYGGSGIHVFSNM